jgi:hypothetical protein
MAPVTRRASTPSFAPTWKRNPPHSGSGKKQRGNKEAFFISIPQAVSRENSAPVSSAIPIRFRIRNLRPFDIWLTEAVGLDLNHFDLA